ncbi:MAG: C-glycoside deglycosidase beta subunit domain-containing protein [Saccharofermentanales bacterium]|jgi:hypothetical protein
MAKVMKFPGYAIVPDSLRNEVSTRGQTVGFCFDLKLRYYRGHYLSCTDEFVLKVDGREIDPGRISFGINGKRLPVPLLPQLASEFWQVTHLAKIQVEQLGGLKPGEHEIDLTFMLRSPYMPNFDPSTPNRYVQIDNCDAGRFTVGTAL